MLEHTKVALAAAGGGHDRAEIFGTTDHALIVVADGVGGMSGASCAVDLVVDIAREIMRHARAPIGALGLERILARMDALLHRCRDAGQCTAVLVEVEGGTICGASAGDSGAWLVERGEYFDLTADQHRKRRLGSGIACPVSFGPLPFEGTLLVASDGLLERAVPDRLVDAVQPIPLSDIAGMLVDRVRLPNGALADDVGLVLARRALRPR